MYSTCVYVFPAILEATNLYLVNESYLIIHVHSSCLSLLENYPGV